MRAESPAAAQNWVEVLNRIRVLKDDTEEDAMGVSAAWNGYTSASKLSDRVRRRFDDHLVHTFPMHR